MADAGKVMPLNKGQWTSGNSYEFLDLAYDGGSTYIAKNDIANSTIAPGTDTTNWQVFARGFAAELLSLIDATDTEGLLGTIDATVTGQALLDEIANRIATKLLPIDNLVNNGTSNVEGFALDSRYGKTLTDEISSLDSNLTDLNTHVIQGNSWTALQSKDGTTWYRMRLEQSGDMNIYESTDSGVTWTLVNGIVKNSDLADAVYIDISFLTASHLQLQKVFGIVTLQLILNNVDIPTLSTYSNVDLPVNIPDGYRPLMTQTYRKTIVDDPQYEGTYIYANTNGAVGIATRYNAIAPNAGSKTIYCNFEYRGQ